jgi:hypothetical protein
LEKFNRGEVDAAKEREDASFRFGLLNNKGKGKEGEILYVGWKLSPKA